nr:anaphase-promoting complex subunit 2 [Tanacetum cinerariifolium]
MRGMLQMLCPDLACDKSLQQLQSFLSGLTAEEKIELRDDVTKHKTASSSGSLVFLLDSPPRFPSHFPASFFSAAPDFKAHFGAGLLILTAG